MLKTGRELYKAIHEGKWLTVVYKNRDQETTRYWIAVKDLDPLNGKISVNGFHVTKHSIMDMTMYFHRIQSAAVLDGTVCDINEKLVEDIRLFPEKYASFFESKVNLGVFDPSKEYGWLLSRTGRTCRGYRGCVVWSRWCVGNKLYG
jgi:hypothetical protein